MSMLNVCMADDSWGLCMVRILRFTPVWASIFLAGYTFHDMTIMTLLASFGALLNFGVNTALTYIIQQPAPLSSISYGEYQATYGMPSFVSQYLVFLFGFFLMFSMIYHQKSLSSLYIAVTYVLWVVCIFIYVHYNINTGAQLLVGAIIGALLCVAYMVFAHFVVIPRQSHFVQLFKNFMAIRDDKRLADSIHNKQPGHQFFDELLQKNPLSSEVEVIRTLVDDLRLYISGKYG